MVFRVLKRDHSFQDKLGKEIFLQNFKNQVDEIPGVIKTSQSGFGLR